MHPEKNVALTLIICSRNDDYMGDPMWRLATSINYVSENIFKLGRNTQVEIVVADWGSETPISEELQLTDKAASITRIVYVPPALAAELQKDSAFGEVYALNVAARRSRGQYIGRIDQDTLVTIDFLEQFFNAFEGKAHLDFDLENTYMFAARKQLPYFFVSKKPGLKDLEMCIQRFAAWIFSEELKFCHWASPVGVLMMHRKMWDDVGGYDERLIYYWFMDVDLATRLIKKYPIVNIGRVFGYHFFHLEHIKPGFKFRHSHRKLNPAWSKSFDKPILNPNGENWGLAHVDLQETTVVAVDCSDDLAHSRFLTGVAHESLLFLQILMISVKRWGYYQLRYVRYLTKKLRHKPYL